MVSVASGAAWGISSRCGYILIEGVRHDGAAGIDLHKGKTNLFTNEGGGLFDAGRYKKCDVWPTKKKQGRDHVKV